MFIKAGKLYLTADIAQEFAKVEGESYYAVKLDSDEKIRYIYSNGYRIPFARSESGGVKFVLENPNDRKKPADLKGFYLQRLVFDS